MFRQIQQIRVLLTPRDKWRLSGIVLLMTFGALLEIVGIGLVLPVVAVFIEPELFEQNAALRFYVSCQPFRSPEGITVFSCVLLGATFVGKNLFALFVVRRQARFVYDRQCDFGSRLFDNYLLAPYAYHLDHPASELNTNIYRIYRICNGFLLPFMQLLADFLVVAALTLVLLCLMPLAALGGALFMTAAGLLVYWPMRRLNQQWGARAMEENMSATRTALNALNGIKEVKTAGVEERFSGDYRRHAALQSGYDGRLYTLGQIPRLALETSAILAALGLFVAMTLLKVPGGTILLTFSLLIAATSRMLPSCSRMHYSLAMIRQHLPFFDSFFHDLTCVPAETAGDPAVPMVLKNELELRNVTFGYSPEKPLFQNFSLRIAACESIALTGTTGSGKTTLVDLLLGLLKPSAGGVFCDGRNIEENLRGWRSGAAYVPQFIHLLDASIRENVMFGASGEDDDEALHDALRMAQLEEFVASLPEAEATVIGENGVKLSGGQRQRLGIARALFRRPRLLILDEATSALDIDTEAAFVAALAALKGKVTIVTIAHRLSTIENCDRVIRL